MELNKYQTPLTDELLSSLPDEIVEQLMDCLNSIPFIKRLVSPDRPYAKDLPRDEKGRIIVDITNPHIIEDADYFRPAALHYMKHGCYTFLRPNSNPNSEYRKFWDEERRRCWEGYVRPSDGEWVTGMLYWFLNYCPMMVNEIVKGTKRAIRKESFPHFFEGIYWRFHYLNQARTTGNHAIELAKRGSGKAHPYDTKVITPEGIRQWGDLRVGDKVFGDNGKETTIVDIPFDDVVDTYEITLRDGRKVQASDGHLWKVFIHNHKNLEVLTTKELFESYIRKRPVSYRNPSGIEYLIGVPCSSGVEWGYKSTKVDPYTFGLLLGDGCFRHKSCYYTCMNTDFDIIKDAIPYQYTKWSGKFAYRLHIPNWTNILKEYGLYWKKSADKFIPSEYIFNSRQVRTEILKGIIDSDGTIRKGGGGYIIQLSSKRMIDDIAFICRSLGYNCDYTAKKTGYRKGGVLIECLPTYILNIHTDDVLCKLPRKQCVTFKSTYAKSRATQTRIVDIKYIGRKKSKCITVDNNSHCYLIEDFIVTHNSYSLASILSHNLILGENEESRRRVVSVLTAYEKEYLSDSKDGTLSKFRPELNFIIDNTPFPRLMLKNSPNEMTWQMGYKDELGIERGSLNQVMAVSAKDNSDKLRGKRGWILFEEMGNFRGLLPLYDVTRKSTEEGDYAFSLMYLLGTANNKEADFTSAKTLLYAPSSYRILALENVYDRPNQGKPEFGFFFPAYINRAGCYNGDGVSDVTKALIQVLTARYNAKYGADPQSVLRVIAEDPITPAEAIIKVKNAFFPVSQLTERLGQLDSDPNAFDDVYIGNLVLDKAGKVQFTPSNDIPIREFPASNDTPGAIEIFEMPEKTTEGTIFRDRYIIGHDPVDNDQAQSSSLSSTFVLDLFTDRIVAEYTGRKAFAEDNFEIVRLLCLFYNAKCLYEAHPYSQLVPTPEGMKFWGDIRIGDILFSPTKSTVKVVDIPVDEEMPIYEIALADGRTIKASDNHIWTVYKGTSKKLIEVTTKQMLEEGLVTKWNQHKFFIPEHTGVEYSYKELPIDPYAFGLILSEGSIRGSHCTENLVQVSSSFEDMKFYENNIPYNVKHIGTKGFSWHMYISNCKAIMQSYNLYGTDSHTKFIPKDYLTSNFSQRMELLKGLMDGDGCASTKGAAIYVTCSKQLAEDVMSLARSLGMKTWLQTTGYGYRVALASTFKLFKLPRKVIQQHIYSPESKGSKANAILNKTAILDIKYSHTERGKCVTVDSEDGLYMIGDYVTTHNCNKKGIFAYFQKMSCTHLLADTPEYLRDKQLIKYNSFGSNQKGVNASSAINNYANGLIRDWLLKPVETLIKDEEGEHMTTIPNLYYIRNRALIRECIDFNPEINVDRIRALGMVMLYREEKMILYNGNVQARTQVSSGLENDPFFERNYRQ